MICKVVNYCCLLLLSFSEAKLVFAGMEKMSDKMGENVAITCYYTSDFNSNCTKNIFTLNELPQTIEFTDEIGENHGGGSSIKGHITENGKVILIEVETGNTVKDSSSTTTNTTTRLHYIDVNLLPRKIAVDGILMKGYVVVEKNDIDFKCGKNKKGCSGYYFFIQDRLTELRIANAPYTGSNASKDFANEWNALPSKEKEKYNQRATSK